MSPGGQNRPSRRARSTVCARLETLSLAADRAGDVAPRPQDHRGLVIETSHFFGVLRLQFRAEHFGGQRVIPPGVAARPGGHDELRWWASSSTMTSGSCTADHVLSSRSRNSGGSPCMSALGAGRGEGARDGAVQGQDERQPETLGPVVVGVQGHPFPGDRAPGLEPLRDRYGFAGGRGPVTRATRQSGWVRTLARRGRVMARTGTAGQPNFERGTENGPPPVAVPVCALATVSIRSRRAPDIPRPKVSSGVFVPGPRSAPPRREYPERVWATHPARRFPSPTRR